MYIILQENCGPCHAFCRKQGRRKMTGLIPGKGLRREEECLHRKKSGVGMQVGWRRQRGPRRWVTFIYTHTHTSNFKGTLRKQRSLLSMQLQIKSSERTEYEKPQPQIPDASLHQGLEVTESRSVLKQHQVQLPSHFWCHSVLLKSTLHLTFACYSKTRDANFQTRLSPGATVRGIPRPESGALSVFHAVCFTGDRQPTWQMTLHPTYPHFLSYLSNWQSSNIHWAN